MQISLFQWLREGVKQSVLLGVSDAVDQMGTIPHNEDFNERLRASLRFEETPVSSGNVTRGTTRKRLGRSLKDA
jgi:hypothetical protein